MPVKVRRAVREMEAYHPPLEQRADEGYLLLDFSESTVPPAQPALDAMKAFLDSGRVRMYPAEGRLRKALSAWLDVDARQLLLTNGSDSAIQLITRALLDAGDEMVMPTPGFFVIESAARSTGADVVSPRYRSDMSFPLEEVLAAVTPRTRLIALVSPNNPTGTIAEIEAVEQILSSHPNVAVLVDEAYHEFSGHTVLPLLERYDNLVVIRTFSKAFALAGLRLGYAVGDPTFIEELVKLRIPYDVNALALEAGTALLEQPEPWQAYVREVMEQAKPMVERFFSEHGVTYYPSRANFLLVQPDDLQGAVGHLREHRILVRPQRAPVSDMFRMSIGTVEQMQRFMQVYADYLAGAGSARRRA